MSNCGSCGARSPRSRRLFCSVLCQQRLRQLRLTEKWLITGVGEPRGDRSNYIRLHLLEEQSNRCATCSLPCEWASLPLALVLDHIDGDASNNRRENLRLICPNCDSQLPTFKSRNRGHGRAWQAERYADGKSY